jgi:hypothetical protein
MQRNHRRTRVHSGQLIGVSFEDRRKIDLTYEPLGTATPDTMSIADTGHKFIVDPWTGATHVEY